MSLFFSGRLFPRSGHLILSVGLDGKARIWDLYHDRSLLRSYTGHSKAIRDANFDWNGRHFLTASYDKWTRLWDTETGACIQTFGTGYMPFCAKFHPDPEKAHLFLTGHANKKIIQVSC